MSPDQAKAAAEAMTGLWQGEVATTTKVLAAVKDDNRDYKPDPKSRSAWDIATHIASADTWFIDSIIAGTFAFDPEAEKQAAAAFTTAASIADYYSTTIPAKLQTLRDMPGEKLTETIDFFGQMKMPRVNFIGFANNHSVHHRGQLASYLRAMGSKVPSIYGPSADSDSAH